MTTGGPLHDARRALLATALLLTGDHGRAEELLQRSLAAPRRGHRGPVDGVLAAMVRAGRLRREQVLEEAAAPGSAGAELARALRELPAATRAAVVLQLHTDADDERAAALLGTTPDAVRARTAEGVARLVPVLGADDFRRPGAEVDPADRVREELARLAAAPGRWQLDDEAAADDVRARRRGRRRLRAGVAVAAAALVALSLTARTTAAEDPPAAAAASTAATTPPPPAPAAVPSLAVLAGPTRGSLAGNPAFVAAARRAGWGPLAAPTVDRRQVVLATDTPAGRAVLVVGTVGGDFRGVWLTGPPGAPVDQLAVSVPEGLGRDRPAVLLLGAEPATLVVVAARGDAVEVSYRLLVDPLGAVSRRYRAAEAVDGVAVLPEQSAASSVRVLREGQVVHRSGVGRAVGPPPPPRPVLPALAPLRPSDVRPDERAVTAALDQLAVPLGTTPAGLAPQLLWAGRLPAPGRPGTVTVLVAQSPGGGQLVTTSVAGPGYGPVSCGTQTPSATTAPTGVTVSRICALPRAGSEAGPDDAWLVVSAPAAATTAEVLDDDGRVLVTTPLTGGAVFPLPEGAYAVRTRDAGGAEIREVPVAPVPSEPFGDYGSGPPG